MTEQEKREYAIDIYNAGIALDATDFAFGVDGDSHFDRLAEHLAQLGYRKWKEVQKETAKKILYRLEKFICLAIDDELLENYVRGLFLLERKHFGLEVEE